MKQTFANWTSTDVPMWETDCLQFWRTGLPFALRNVVLPEHERFVREFAAFHKLAFQKEDGTVIFTFEATPE